MTDLENRIAARKADLIAEIIEHKRNSSRGRAAEEIDRIGTQLSELAQIVRESLGGGWKNVDSKAKVRLTRWLEA